MTYKEASSIVGGTGKTTNDLRYIGFKGTSTKNAFYWLDGANGTVFYAVVGSGEIFTYLLDSSFFSEGIRPVIELKANIKTSGKGKDAVGQEAWELVVP